MPRELKNANITHISYVDKAANKTKFFLTKAETDPTFQKDVRIVTKADDPQQLVYGLVYEPETTDSQGDFMTAPEIEKAAHTFMTNFIKADGKVLDTQHNFEPGVGDLVESYVAPADMTVGDQTIKKGSWVMVSKASDEIWTKIQKGEITGYSMAGTAETIQKGEEAQMKGFFQLVKDFFIVQKGEVKDRFDKTRKSRDFWASLRIFEDILYEEILWKGSDGLPDMGRVKAAGDDFISLLGDIITSPTILKSEILTEIQKVGKKISASRIEKLKAARQALDDVLKDAESVNKSDEGEIDMKPEELAQVIKDAVAAEIKPVADRLSTLEKAATSTETTPATVVTPATTPVETPTVLKAEDIKTLVSEVLKAELKPVTDRLDVVEKARGISKADPAETNPTEVTKDSSVFGSLFQVSSTAKN